MKKVVFALLCSALFSSCFLQDLRMYKAEQEARGGDPQRAVALYLSIDPALADPVIAYNCAVLYTRLKEYKAAQNLYDRIIRGAPESIPHNVRAAALFNAALIYYDNKENTAALALLRNALVIAQDKDILALYHAILAGINPGSGVSSVTQVTGRIGEHDDKDKAIFIAPVPYGVLFPGSADNDIDDASDH